MKVKDLIPASKPRNFVAKNQKTAGAGAHKDKKRAEKQGDVKHKGKQYDEGMAEAVKKPNATTRHLRDYPVSDKDVAKPVKKPEKKKPEQGVAERIRDPKDWDEGSTEPGNNFAVYINGKKWKVFPGPYGAYADSPEEEREFYRLKDMARRKSEATGKKWEVSKTGEPATK